MKNHFAHLNQNTTKVYGPIQDDEAILLYGLVRTMGLKYIVELGGLNGYSAQNFIKAINGEGKVISIDPNFNNKYNITSNNFIAIKQRCENVAIVDLPIPRIDLLFFDCHVLKAQMDFFHRGIKRKFITDNTILVLHDTDVKPIKDLSNIKNNPTVAYVNNNNKTRGNTGIYPIKTAKPERIMVNQFMDMGYVPLHAHANYQDCPNYIENFRHGLTILSKPYKLLY